MRKVVAVEYVTVDGVMADPGGVGEIEHGGWSNQHFDDELAKHQTDQLFANDALLLGRVTFAAFADAWRSMHESEREWAVRMNAVPNYVASRWLEKPLAWKRTLLKGDLVEEVGKLKQRPGQTLLIYGSSEV